MLFRCRLISSLAVIAAICIVAPTFGQTKRIKPDAGHLVFRCKALIDPVTGTIVSHAIIETNGGRILRVGKAGDFPIAADAQVMDYGDKYAIPGLIDTHGHLYGGVTERLTTSPFPPPFYLAAGVTSVGAPGSMDPGGDLAMRNRIDSGLYPGPRYFLAGEYFEMSPVTVRWMNPVSTPEEARIKVDYWAAQGVAQIKLYANMKGDVMQATIDEAHEHGLRVVAHMGATSFKQAMDMGVDELFHGVLAMTDSSTQRGGDLSHWTDVVGNIDLAEPSIQAMLRQAAEERVVMTPTIAVLEINQGGYMEKHHMQEQRKYFTAPAWEKIEEYARQPPDPKFQKAIQNNIVFTRMAHDAGCILSTGTDYTIFTMLPGFSLWREMELFGEAGLKPMDILKAATVNGAYSLGRSDQIGSIESGKLADFVFLNADPIENISNVRSVYRVVKGGVVYDPQEVLKPFEGKVN